jgi:monofunctional biosynthetic peptidoglycan transglycosylase
MLFRDYKKRAYLLVLYLFSILLASPVMSMQAMDNSANNNISKVSVTSEDANALVELTFNERSELNNWIIVNDTVMGGRSRAQLTLGQQGLQFSGSLSLENNGGFASIRRVYNGKKWLTDKAIQITVVGDGRPYQFRMRTNRRVDDVAYVANFDTLEGEVQTLTFIESDFTPQFRGRLVSRAPALDFSNVEQLGIMLADKNPGSFTISVTRIAQLN